MKKILDARKKQCPIPIIMAKDAMKEVDVIEIIVDNEIAMQNLYKLAKQKNYQIQSEKKDNDYIVNLIKGSHVVETDEPIERFYLCIEPIRYFTIMSTFL